MRFADICICTGLVLGAAPALAADAQQGRFLYDTYCGICHYERVHERKTTHIKTREALRAEVAKWATQVPRGFTPAEVADIAKYLDQSHYHLAQ